MTAQQEMASHSNGAPVDDPFGHFKFSLRGQEDSQVTRHPCPSCGASHWMYCPSCRVPLDSPTSSASIDIPLPVPLTLIKHPREKSGKSTACHAKITAPSSVEFIESDCEDLNLSHDPSRTLLLFPSTTAVPISTLDPSSFDRVIVIDGTWRQARTMTRLLAVKYHRHVCIQAHETLFWRYQNYDKFHLATIEAIYWFYRELHGTLTRDGESVKYEGEYDDMLWYFYRQYALIQGVYKENRNLSFCKRKLDAPTYIKYGPSVTPIKDANQDVEKTKPVPEKTIKQITEA